MKKIKVGILNGNIMYNENIDEDSDDRIKKISKFNLELLDNKRLLEIIDALDSIENKYKNIIHT